MPWVLDKQSIEIGKMRNMHSDTRACMIHLHHLRSYIDAHLLGLYLLAPRINLNLKTKAVSLFVRALYRRVIFEVGIKVWKFKPWELKDYVFLKLALCLCY